MAETQTTTGIVEGVDKALAALEAQAQELQAGPATGAQRSTATGTIAAGVPSLDDLALTISRLKQIKDWFQQDQRLVPIIDEFIGQKVKASEKRTNTYNTWLAVATTVVGALLGWLVSTVLPTPFLH